MNRQMHSYTSASIKGEYHALNPVDLISVIGAIDEERGFITMKLKWPPIEPGTFEIEGLRVKDRSDSILYDAAGSVCGAINYKTGELAIAASTIIGHEGVYVAYEYRTQVT